MSAQTYEEYLASRPAPIKRDHKGENCACRCAAKNVPKEYWCYCDDLRCCPKEDW